MTDCAAKGQHIHIDLANQRSTIKLTAPNETTAVDWAKMIKLEAHTQGIENPLNLEVQAACQGAISSGDDALYSKYQDFKCAGDEEEEGEPSDAGNDGQGVGYMDLPAGQDGSGYMDIPQGGSGYMDLPQGGSGYMDLPQGGVAAEQLPDLEAAAKFNAAGKQRPSRPKRPPRPARPSSEPEGGADGPGYMDVKIGGTNSAHAADGPGYMDVKIGGTNSAHAAEGNGGPAGVFVHVPPPVADADGDDDNAYGNGNKVAAAASTDDQAYLDVTAEAGVDSAGVGASGGAPDDAHYLATTAAAPEEDRGGDGGVGASGGAQDDVHYLATTSEEEAAIPVAGASYLAVDAGVDEAAELGASGGNPDDANYLETTAETPDQAEGDINTIII